MMNVIPELKRLHSPDVLDLESYNPDEGGTFCILLQAMFGPSGVEGEESFDFLLCNPAWIAEKFKSSPFFGKNYLIVTRFDYLEIKSSLEKLARECEANTWENVAAKLSRYGKWEFEDYEDRG